ncbi:uncharacterized protein [Henckelia pumila]|uniref:uncharacterized protein n=1 Tax=Henckelia pumila TaxID=405737 RepID=UPI003C6E428F
MESICGWSQQYWGSGVGVILISPTQDEIKIDVKLDFQASNNESEYEAVIAGMKQAREVGENHILIYFDSQLVVQRVKKAFFAREERLIKYLQVIEELRAVFVTWSIEQIPREENMEADALEKKAVAREKEDIGKFLVQRELVAAIEALEPVPREDTWMAPIIKYLTSGDIPADEGQARITRRQAPRFALLGGTLYRRSYQGPLLKCLMKEKIEYVLREVHEGCCGNHGGSMSLARRWGLDIVGPFPQARAHKKFLLVKVDYFSKWVDAEALAKIIEGEVMKFLWKNIVCRFGLPMKLVSDNGRQFQGHKLTDWCAEMGIKQAFTSVAYPQSNGQTEVTNRTLVRSLQARLYGMGRDWVKEIPSVLWAYRTTPHTATQESPFSLIYGSEAILPVEFGQPSSRIMAYDEAEKGARAQELDLIEERRARAAVRPRII